jgi:hypothetical protein
MTATTPENSDTDEAADRLATGEATVETRGPHRWFAAAAVAAIAAAGLLAGSGSAPGDVIGWARDLVSKEPVPDIARAQVVASDSKARQRVEVWAGPATSGSERCSFVRVRWDGGQLQTADRCSNELVPWSEPDFTVLRSADYFGSVVETPIGTAETGFDGVSLSGLVHPAITAVTAHFGDGSEYSFVPTSGEGWFAVILPSGVVDMDPADGHLVNVLVTLELFDANGGVLATVDVPSWLIAERSG